MLAGALLKALHLAGGGILLTLSILLFCFGFLPSALISSYKSQEVKKYKWLYIVTFIVFCIDLIGALFKIQHWPFAGLFLVIGLPLPFILFLPVYLYHTHKNKSNSVLNNLGIMFGLTFLAIFSVLLAVNVSTSILGNFALINYNNEKSAKFYQTVTKSYSEKDIIVQKSDELCAYIDELKCELLTATKNDFCVNGKIQDGYNPTRLTNPAAQTSILFEGKSPNKIEILKNKILEFKELISTSNKNSKELLELTNSLFDIENKEIQNNGEVKTQNWEERELPTTHLSIHLKVLSRIQSNVRFVENEYLSSL